MHQKTKNSIKKKIVNMFGAFSYLAVTLQWLWVIALYLNVIKDVLIANTPKVTHPIMHAPSTVSSPPSPIVIVLGAVVTLLAIAMMIFFIVKVPKAIVKTTTRVVNNTAESIVPVVLHIQHKQDTTSNHRKTTFNLRMVIKILLIMLPLVAAFISEVTKNPLYSAHITTYVSLVLAGLSTLLFTVQYFIAKLLKVKRTELL
jgi:hypothetical protein